MSVIINVYEDTAFNFVKRNYLNGNLAVEIVSHDEEIDFWEPWCMLTTNIDGYQLKSNQAFIDTNNCNREIINWLIKNMYINEIAVVPSGYCMYPLVEFSKGFMEQILITEEDLMESEDDYE